MALDPSAREANVRDSLKKFFVDSLSTGEGYALTFDKGLAKPALTGVDIDRWVSINFGPMELSELSEHSLRVFCCTRKDNEGFKLAQVRDTVMGYLTDTTQTDGMKRIALYRSFQNQPWVAIAGGIVVQEVVESEQYEADDETKYKVLNVRLRWSAKA